MLRGSIPPTGLPLPFVSAGSTALVVFMSDIGVDLNGDRAKSVEFSIFNEMYTKYKHFVYIFLILCYYNKYIVEG